MKEKKKKKKEEEAMRRVRRIRRMRRMRSDCAEERRTGGCMYILTSADSE